MLNLLAFLGDYHILHVKRLRVKLVTTETGRSHNAVQVYHAAIPVLGPECGCLPANATTRIS